MTLGTKLVVSNFDDTNDTCVSSIYGGQVDVLSPGVANYLQLTNCYLGVTAYHNSSFYGAYTRASGTSVLLSMAFHAGQSSEMLLTNAQASSAGYGYLSIESSTIYASTSIATGCTFCYLATATSTIMAPSANANAYAASGYGFYAQHNSYVNAQAATADGSANANDFGFMAEYGGVVFAAGATSTNNTNGVLAQQAGYVQAATMTITGATTPYTPAVNTQGTRMQMIGN